MNRTLWAAAVIAVAFVATAQAEERISRPAQAAYLQGEIRKAQQAFVARVAALSGVPEARIREWVPTDGRDVPPKVSILPALQRERAAPFTEEERQAINAAEQERFDAIARARHEALKK
ncbi:MAG: hypothetical protein WBP72_01425 [Rhodocyclaceae bacterium]